MSGPELGRFLRNRRERLRPGDVGLIPGGRRRAVGLRREEVALLAGMSADYYERIEQGRGPTPSPAMLGAVARALRLSVDERDYLYRLADQPAPERHIALGHAEPGLLCILDALAPSVPALISDDMHFVIAQNALNVALLGDLAGASGRDGNFLWRWFTDRELRGQYRTDQHAALGREYVADLRVAYGKRPTDPAVTDLVAALRRASDEFSTVWDRQDVALRRTTRKALHHAAVGALELDCDVVVSPPSGQRLVLFRPVPGTGSGERLAMLGVLGSQSLEPVAADSI